MTRALALTVGEEWGAFQLCPHFLRTRNCEYNISCGATRVPVIALKSLVWSTAPSASLAWPWVQGKSLTGGLYSPSAGRIIPFHKPETWYQLPISPVHVVPLAIDEQHRMLTL